MSFENTSKFAIFYENPCSFFLFFISSNFIFFTIECPGLCQHRQWPGQKWPNMNIYILNHISILCSNWCVWWCTTTPLRCVTCSNFIWCVFISAFWFLHSFDSFYKFAWSAAITRDNMSMLIFSGYLMTDTTRPATDTVDVGVDRLKNLTFLWFYEKVRTVADHAKYQTDEAW